MLQFNDNPFAPQKMRAINATGYGYSYGTSPNAGVVDRNNPNSGYSYPGPRNNIGTTPTPPIGRNTPSAPNPRNPGNPAGNQQVPGGNSGGFSSALHGTAVDAASRGAFGPSGGFSSAMIPVKPRVPAPVETAPIVPPPTYAPPPLAAPIDGGYNAPVPIDPPYGPGSGDPSNPYNTQPEAPAIPQLSREDWRDKWMGSGIHDIAGLKQFLSQYGGQLLSDNGTARTPFGEIYDLLIGAKTGNGTPGWTPVSGASSYDLGPSGPQSIEIPGLKDLLDKLASLSAGQGDVKTARQPAPFANAYGPMQWNPQIYSGGNAYPWYG